MLSSLGDLMFNGLVAAVALLERTEKALDGHNHRDSSSTLAVAASAATNVAIATSSAIAAYYAYMCDLVCDLFALDANLTDASNLTTTNDDDDDDNDANHSGISSIMNLDDKCSTSCCTNDATIESADTPTTTTVAATATPSPRWQDFAIQSRNFAFTCKIEAGFHFRFGHLFATYEERTATRMVLSALHGYWEIISWEHALIPMAHDALRRCNQDEQAAFEHLLANKQLYEHLFSEEWCWKYGCVGCSLPRNKFEYYGDDLKAQGFTLFEY
jgi:hypothetical protein|uniref:Uncharacterized protein n=1 Tax=Globisporangium ultimum (strain ATCC 200006 / CBS 805.95 / DAOM BR144) TaxID=431595 RepID=K3WPU3_GLOUD